MALFDTLNPMKNITPRFTEEQLSDIIAWFDENAKPILLINDEPTNAVTVEQLQTFYALKKFHRRNYNYPSYGEIMLEAEKLQVGTVRMFTRSQFIYILNNFVVDPSKVHELKLAFQVFDTEKRNFLILDDLQQIMNHFDEPFTEEEKLEFIRDANVRGDGEVYYENFVDSLFDVEPGLLRLKPEYLYDDPDEDPSVPPLPPTPEPSPPPTPPPPPPPKAKGKKK